MSSGITKQKVIPRLLPPHFYNIALFSSFPLMWMIPNDPMDAYIMLLNSVKRKIKLDIVQDT